MPILFATFCFVQHGGYSYSGCAKDEVIGTELEGGWWVKARVVQEVDTPSRKVYLACRGSGRDVERQDHIVADV